MIDRDAQSSASLRSRLAWFVILWAAGVVAVAGIAWLIRLVLV